MEYWTAPAHLNPSRLILISSGREKQEALTAKVITSIKSFSIFWMTLSSSSQQYASCVATRGKTGSPALLEHSMCFKVSLGYKLTFQPGWSQSHRWFSFPLHLNSLSQTVVPGRRRQVIVNTGFPQWMLLHTTFSRLLSQYLSPT